MTLNLLWYSGMRLTEAANVKAKDFNWEEGTVVILGKATGIHCNPHSFRRGFCVHNVKSGLSNKVIQSLGGWETPDMVSHYAQSLTFEEALELYHKLNSYDI